MFDHRAGVVLLLHMEDRGLDAVEIEPLAQHVDQIELAADDAPGRADRESRGLGVDDRRIPALMNRLIILGQFLVALKMLELEERAARRRRPLEDLRAVLAFAEVPEKLLERSPVEPFFEQQLAGVELPAFTVAEVKNLPFDAFARHFKIRPAPFVAQPANEVVL